MPTNHNPFEENEEPKQNRAQALLLEYQSNAFPLGQTDLERSICTMLSMLQKTSSKTISCSICTMLSMLQKTPSETKYCIICTMLSMRPGSGVTRGQFSLRSSWVLHSFSVSVLQHLHHSSKSCETSRSQNQQTRELINQRLERRHTHTPTKTRVAYGNSHLAACE